MFIKFFKYTFFILTTVFFTLIEDSIWAYQSAGSNPLIFPENLIALPHNQIILPRAPQVAFSATPYVRSISRMAINYYLDLIRRNPYTVLNERDIPSVHRNTILARLTEQELTTIAELSEELWQLIEEHRVYRTNRTNSRNL